MPNNYNVRTVTRPAKPRSKALQGLPAGTSSGSSAPGGLLSGYVTLSTEQTITAPKTFAEDATFGAAKEDGTYSRLLIPSTSGPGIYDLYVSTEPVDGEAPSASGGIDEDELWTILGGSSISKVIDPSHIPVIPVEKVSGLSTALASYATKKWVEGKGYLTSVSLSTISDLHASWDTLLQSAPDFYSKGSVYTKSEADGRFVGIANEQTVTGRKAFSALLTASGGISGSNADLSGYLCATKLYLPYSGGNKVYDICISTQPIDGEAPSEGGGINEEELWTILGGNGTQKIGASHIPPLSDLSGNLDSSRITGLDSALTGYVKKAGDTMTGTLTVPTLNVNSNAFIYESASHATRLTFNWTGGIARIYAINNSGSGYYDLSLGQTPGNNAALYFDASAARWGIGTTSPAYKLDVAGEIRATSGITIGSTDDYGWYISTGTRISAGVGVARGVNVGSLLVSSGWADYTKVPTNGIYSMGDIWTGGKLYIPSTQGNNVFDAYIA